MADDDRFINKYPDDAAEMAALVRRADDLTAVRLLQIWGSKQRDVGAIKALEMFKEQIHA